MTLLRLRPALRCATAGLALSLAAGCASNSGHQAGPPPSASAKPTPSASDEADRSAALTAYRQFWAEQVKSYAQGTTNGTDLEKYATDQALGKVRIQMVKDRDAGIVFKGEPKINPSVSAIDVTASPKTATLTDCLDISGWTPVDAKTGDPKPVTNPQLRYVATASARTVGSDWKIIDFSSDKSRPC